MEKLKVLKVVFNQEIKSWEIPAFRGAIIDKTKRDDNLLFHNHFEEGLRYKYPLIQYKTIHRKASLICLGEGVNEVHKFFNKQNWDIYISDRKLPLEIEELQMNQFTIQVWDRMFDYRILNWIALNKENYALFGQITSDEDKKKFLEQKLIANIISMAKGIGWDVDKQIICSIKSTPTEKMVKVKDASLKAYSLEFSTNVFLPNFIGLGKSSSLGYGIVSSNRRTNHEQ